MEWEWNPAIRAIIFIYSQLKRRKKIDLDTEN